MKLIIAIVFFSLFSLVGFSQASFYSGYFITNNGNRTECLIKDDDWTSNLKEFYYKFAHGSDKMKKGIEEVKEFGIVSNENRTRFVRAEVLIDKDRDTIGKLTSKRSPTWVKEIAFLEILVEGYANLYLYQEKNLIKFFFNTSSQDSIKQLVYRRYFLDESSMKNSREKAGTNNYIKSNNTFRQQLSLRVNCGGQLATRISNLTYNRKQLTDYFKFYNETCHPYSSYFSGYFITNNNERINCLLKDTDWYSHPSKVTFKISKDANPDFIGVHGIKELEFYNLNTNEKFVFAETLVDNSQNAKTDKGNEQLIDWQKKKQFLKVLVEGDANLYSIKEGDYETFFFNTTKHKSIQQLLFNRYYADEKKEVIIEDYTFKKQLHLIASCWGDQENMSYRLTNLVYRKSMLINYFESYNRKCKGRYLFE